MSYGQQQKKEPYSFTDRHRFMLEARTLLDKAYYPHFAYEGHWVFVGGNSRGSIHIQRDAHIDTIVQITAQGQTLTIDEKLDSQNRSTIFAETVSMKEYSKPGWMVPGISQADVLLWAFSMKRPLGLKVYTFWLQQLIEWFWPRQNQFQEYLIHNKENGKRWTTLGHQVPINVIPTYCFLKDKEIVTNQLEMPL